MKKSITSVMVFSALFASSAMASGWPEKPITIIVPWGAGGNTDTVARLVAKGLQSELGVNVNVVNKTGGSGVVGHDATKRAKADGYTLGIATVEITMMRHQGMTDLSYEDYTPISRLAVIYGGLQVSKDSPFNTAAELMEFAKKNPGKLKASGSGLNSIWHFNSIGMQLSADMPKDAIKFIPSQGSSAALQELVSGGVDVVTSSPGEAKGMVKAGMVKHLAVMAPEKSGLYPEVPVFKEATPYNWELQAWNMLVAPKGLDKAIQDKLVTAMKKVYASGELDKFARKQGFEVSDLYANDAYKFMAAEDKKFASLLAK
ncbi:tripartite tricarboxylate transporter substrate binding protein [Vibrio sp. JC009]|uniref:tripartite tricarboxylate transporter substrate binding protein n=1 Tax=Vibrio sp. JC009 TaxID=2912314 RepID=UPI0023AFE40F|nr:tripartite tricarboxylate transporter substrate binding protein [Vibrio sp. JC009]WED24029.1 tripartite tricarboxylate transporter substrate binding protein [Vibrio sp. JC009]